MSPMNTPALAAIAALMALSVSACGNDQPDDTALSHMQVMKGEIRAEQPWVRAVPEGARMSAGYVAIQNTGTKEDSIVAVSSDSFSSVELHESRTVDGRSTMRKIDRLDLPGGRSVTLEPGGYHLMLFGAEAGIAEGDTVEITITFEKAGDVTIPFTARNAGPGGHNGH